jgi:hypothetical protein
LALEHFQINAVVFEIRVQSRRPSQGMIVGCNQKPRDPSHLDSTRVRSHRRVRGVGTAFGMIPLCSIGTASIAGMVLIAARYLVGGTRLDHASIEQFTRPNARNQGEAPFGKRIAILAREVVVDLLDSIDRVCSTALLHFGLMDRNLSG